MAEREKVIRGLELCAYDPDPGQPRKEIFSCSDCPYYRGCYHGCAYDLIRDALALLKAQEPRVLSEEEVRERLGTFVWVEICSPHADCSICLVFGKVYEDPAYPDLVTIREGSGVAWGRRWEDYGAGCWRGIRSGWRCWTARPTEKQRKAVAWNG